MKPHAWLVCGALLAALSVTMGAFGAHGLKEYLEAAKRVDTFETAARYHMYHAIALVLVGLLASAGSNRALDVAGGCFLAGILIFSGLCYALALGGPKYLGAIVPIGGVAFIAGWVALAVGALRSR
ncbi:MAG TPA: DUF423 domain-containing protein [Pirellulales bacterium]|nr:DUF423 domain-containing protein [Pirellulales bacterium]